MNAMDTGPRWHLVIPVKGGLRANTRLRAPAGVSHAALSCALALDTALAAAATVTPTNVLLVTSDAPIADQVAAAGIRVLPDPGLGLNRAVRAGLDHLHRAGVEGPTGVLLGDLPALRAADLGQALTACGAHERAFVPDLAGTGTVLLTGATPGALDPCFGQASAARHTRAGHQRLDLDLPGLRTDVDDERSLAAVVGLGAGPHTTRLLSTTGPVDGDHLRAQGA